MIFWDFKPAVGQCWSCSHGISWSLTVVPVGPLFFEYAYLMLLSSLPKGYFPLFLIVLLPLTQNDKTSGGSVSFCCGFPCMSIFERCVWILTKFNTKTQRKCDGNFPPRHSTHTRTRAAQTHTKKDNQHLRHLLPKVAGNVTYVAFRGYRNIWCNY